MKKLIKQTNIIKDNMGNTYTINIYAPAKTPDTIKEYNKRIAEAIRIGINSNK